jgi:hypothetical protein
VRGCTRPARRPTRTLPRRAGTAAAAASSSSSVRAQQGHLVAIRSLSRQGLSAHIISAANEISLNLGRRLAPELFVKDLSLLLFSDICASAILCHHHPAVERPGRGTTPPPAATVVAVEQIHDLPRGAPGRGDGKWRRDAWGAVEFSERSACLFYYGRMLPSNRFQC